MTLALRRLAARLIPALGYARCSHCHLPWSVCDPHLLQYQNYRSLFFVCTWCWPRTTRLQRSGYLDHLIWVVWAETTSVEELDRVYDLVRPLLRDKPMAEVA